MESTSRDDIRRLLKTFGVKADELLISYLARLRHPGPLRVALILEDRTAYAEPPPDGPLHLEIEGEISR
jgi:hypothetical protein